MYKKKKINSTDDKSINLTDKTQDVAAFQNQGLMRQCIKTKRKINKTSNLSRLYANSLLKECTWQRAMRDDETVLYFGMNLYHPFLFFFNSEKKVGQGIKGKCH